MSFDVVCDRCGAPSGPSVGMCPFCKGVIAGPSKDAHPTLTKIRKFFNEGKLEQALSFASAAEAEQKKLSDNPTFLLTYVKILFETEGPTSKMKSLLVKLQTKEETDQEVTDYWDLIEAKHLMTHGTQQAGELLLKSLLRRSPNNAHALFLLGSQAYYANGDIAEAVRCLERCVSLRPCFLRAWGCLGVIYRATGDGSAAERAFKKCLSLETNAKMKAFFTEQLNASDSREQVVDRKRVGM